MPICPKCKSSRFVQHENLFKCLDCGLAYNIYLTAKITPETKLELSENAFIGDYVFIHLKTLKMGVGAQINAHSSLTGGGTVEIGDYSVVGYGVRLITGTDNPRGEYVADSKPENQRHIIRGSIKIGKNCLIGSNAVICVSEKCKDITIGDNSVIGSQTYIDKSIPPNVITIPEQKLKIKPRFSSKRKAKRKS